MNKKILLKLIFNFIFLGNIFSQINSPYFLNSEFESFKKNKYNLVFKEDFYPKFYNNNLLINYFYSATNGYDLKNKKSLAIDRIGLYSTVQIDSFRFYIGYGYGIYKNDFFSQFTDTTEIIPSIGKVKKNKNNLLFFDDLRFKASYSFKYLTFEIGRGKTFLGNGYRSLWLSDFSSPYPYFRAKAQIWKIFYLYQISQLKDKYPLYFDRAVNKYNFTHLLAFNFKNILNFYMFETVMSGAYDERGLRKGLELAYLNPVIFFRAVDLSLGSPDNVIMGLGGNLKFFKNTLIYGQAFIDEFLFSHIISRDGYWDNKYGIQIGLKSYKTFIQNLYSQFEINLIRPYTFSHWDIYLAYGNNYQPLAHPLGANFFEKIANLTYYKQNYFIQLKAISSYFGLDDTLNNGKNIYKSYLTHYKETGNFIGQGHKTYLNYLELNFGYKIKNTWLQVSIANRKIYSDLVSQNNLLVMLKLKFNFFDNEYLDWY